MQNLTERLASAVEALGLTVEEAHESDVDLYVVVPVVDGERRLPLLARTSTNPMGPAELERWRNRHQHLGPLVLGVHHVSRATGERYRAAGIQYLDSGGNAHLRLPGLLVQVEGRKPPGGATAGNDLPMATKSGLRVAFTLLVDPDALHVPYEQLSQRAGVSKGSVVNAMAGLTRAGFVTASPTRALVDVPRMVEDWIDGYRLVLQPRLQRSVFSGPPPEWWWKEDAPLDGGLLSGGAALRHYGADLLPARTVVFGHPPWHELRRHAQLVPRRDQGTAHVFEVELREQFWKPTEVSRYVPELLAVADGLGSLEPREVDAARALLPAYLDSFR
ncbi:type IV toxin-antitoxin system AbiEi family antitoxin [Aquipuribacter sp. SD81]|uniref:type IV toxin-antitoxin system AbiEi family antitoxin n=1 Tax=Aquipuribacter sp. SD81 TaxID=3127703 RepID=UPI00301604ED